MQLRTHPKMKWEGFSNWPPTWGGSYGSGTSFLSDARCASAAQHTVEDMLIPL
jgi:hypothetical protein